MITNVHQERGDRSGFEMPIGWMRFLRSFSVRGSDQIADLLNTGQHSSVFSERRARLVLSRARLFSILFAVLTPLCIPVDALVFPPAVWPFLALARLAASVAFASVVFYCSRVTSLKQAYVALAALFSIPSAFFLISHALLWNAPLSGIGAVMGGGYAYLPFVQVAGLAIFPLTILEATAFLMPLLAIASIPVIEHHTFIVATFNVFAVLWLLALVAAAAAVSAVSQLEFFLAHANDTDEIKRRSEALKESEGRYAAANSQLLDVLSAIPEGIAIYDADDRLVLCNDQYRGIFPKAADIIVPGMRFEDLVRANVERGSFKLPVSDKETFFVERLALHRKVASLSELKLFDGRWIQVRKRRTGRGELVGVWTDITDIREREEALRESQERYALAMEGVGEGLWYFDIVRDEVHFSPRIAKMIGAENLSPKTARQLYARLIHPKDSERRRNAYLDYVKGHTSYYVCEYRLRRTDGSYRWVSDHGLGQRDCDGRVYRMAGSLSDITERKTREIQLRIAKEQAESANRAKTIFLANMSHELRTPLNAVMGFSDIIRQELMGPVGSEKYRDYAEDIYQSGSHLLEVINDILDVAKIESGKEELHDEAVNVLECIYTAVSLVQCRAESRQIKIESNAPSDLPLLRADGRKFKQILINLLSNSVKFTPPGGRVTITAAITTDGSMRVDVADTGIGIAANDLQKVLSPFGQVDNHLNRKYQGTGLGLSLVQGLARMHGASFDLASQINKGTTATLVFPAHRIIALETNATSERALQATAAKSDFCWII